MAEQMSIFDLTAPEVPAEDEIPADALFAPNGRQRCPHCRRRLQAFGGRLVCVAAYCTGVQR